MIDAASSQVRIISHNAVLHSSTMTNPTASSRPRPRSASISISTSPISDSPVDHVDHGDDSSSIPGDAATPDRYADFTTVDWVQDALQTHTRRRLTSQQKAQYNHVSSRNRNNSNDNGNGGRAHRSVGRRLTARIRYGGGLRSWLRRTISESYEAGQAWVVVSLVGLAIGVNSAMLNVVTEWLSDVKLGYCRDAVYLNQQFCCWGVEGRGMSCICLRLRPGPKKATGKLTSSQNAIGGRRGLSSPY